MGLQWLREHAIKRKNRRNICQVVVQVLLSTVAMAMNQDLSIPCARTTPAAGEAFIQSFTDMTRAMLAQSKALARTVSLAQVLETDSNRDCNTNTGDDHDDDKENIIHVSEVVKVWWEAGVEWRERI